MTPQPFYQSLLLTSTERQALLELLLGLPSLRANYPQIGKVLYGKTSPETLETIVEKLRVISVETTVRHAFNSRRRSSDGC